MAALVAWERSGKPVAVLVLCAGLLTVGPARDLAADCMSDCRRDYNACIYAYDERDCATTQSICQTSCVMGTNTFGAIAYSPATGGYGYATGYQSRVQAESEALGQCAKHGDEADCKVQVWFRGQCGALAAVGGAYGSAFADTEDAARDQALEYCQAESGGTDCEVLVEVCSE